MSSGGRRDHEPAHKKEQRMWDLDKEGGKSNHTSKPNKLPAAPPQLLGSILVNATSRQIDVFQIKILSELVRVKRREYLGQLAK